MSGTPKLILNQDLWSEDFQDLSVYCNTGSKIMDNSAQPLGEQLNTPVIQVQDEFDFNGHGNAAGELIDESDPWAPSSIQQSTHLNTDPTQWDSVENWLYQQNIDESEYIVDDIDIDAVDEQYNMNISDNDENKHFLTTDKDFLLSQSSNYDQSLQYIEEVNNDNQHINELSVFKPEPQYCERNNVDMNDRQQLLSIKNENNNSITVNMNNNIINSNNNYSNNFAVKQLMPKQNQLSTTMTKSAFVSQKTVNKRNKKNVQYIFESEEPLICEANKEFTSCTNNTVVNPISNDTSLRLAAIIISPDEVATTSIGSNNILLPQNVKYVKSYNNQISSNSNNNQFNCVEGSMEFVDPEFIKTEPIDNTDKEVETINEHNYSIDNKLTKSSIDNSCKSISPSENLNSNSKKTGLKLDIKSASKLIANAGTPTTVTPLNMNVVAASTPEVCSVLNSNTGFNLLSYLEDEGVSSPTVFSIGDKDSPVIEPKKNVAVIKPIRQRKRRAIKEEKFETIHEIPKLEVVKEEDDCDNDVKPSTSEIQDSLFSDNVSTCKKPVTRRTTSKRRRIPKKSDDMESDLSNLSDFVEEDDEKHDKTFEPTRPSYKRKRTISNTSTSTRTSTSTTSLGRGRKLSRDTDSSDHDSSISGNDRYRELRDRNNEASRRSRLNRKTREYVMKLEATKLEEENRKLKAKASEMEKLVTRLRDNLMQLVLKNNKPAN